MKRPGLKNRIFVLTTLVLLILSSSFGMIGGSESAIPPQIQQGNNIQIESANKLQPAPIATEPINAQQPLAPPAIESTRARESESTASPLGSPSDIGIHRVRVNYYKVYIHNDHDSGNWPHEGGGGEWRFALKVDLKDNLGLKPWSYEPDLPYYYELRQGTFYFSGSGLGQTRDLKHTNQFTFSARAREYDWPLQVDYESRLSVSPVVSSFNVWHGGSQQQGDVTHYYRYRMDNRDPVANSRIAIRGGFPYHEGSNLNFFLLDPAETSDPDGDGIEYQWDQYYTPGSFSVDSTSPSPTFTYNSPGSYTIAYRVKDALGAYSNIYTSPLPIYNVPPTATLSNDGPKTEGIPVKVSFSNQYDPGDADTFTYSFDWDNDGTFDIKDQDESFATHTWDDSGIYTVRGRITDDYGRSTDYTTSITVEPPRVTLSINNGATETDSMSVVLTISPTEAFNGVDEMRFRNEGEAWTDWEPFALSKNWMLPIGDGLKTVYIQDRDPTGKIGESFDDILLDTTIGSHPLTVIYYAATIYYDHDPDWLWSIPGDWRFAIIAYGATARSPLYSRHAGYFNFPDLVLSTSAIYPHWPSIRVEASEWDGSNLDYRSSYTIHPPSPLLLDHEYFEDITIGDVRHYFKWTLHNTAPTANPITGGTIFEGQSITLQGIGDDPDGDSFAYQWDKAYDGITFDDDYQSSNPTILYATPGTYTVAFRTVDAFGKASTIQTATVEVIPLGPTLTLSGPLSVPEGADYTLSLSASGPGAETISEWTIDWGDGTIQPVSGNPSSITHTYADGPNSYIISATATTVHYTFDADNTLMVLVTNVAPTVDAGIDQNADEGTPVNFQGGIFDPGFDDIHMIEWDFGDGTTASGTLTPIHTYADNDIYTVKLTVTDNGGAVGSDTLVVTINNVAPLVDAGDDLSGFEGDTFDFSGSAIDPGDADILTIEWDFGDGATASGSLTPSHVYADNGIYTVTLTVTDDDGATAADTLAVLVSNVAPLVDAGDDLSGFEGASFDFSGSATDPGDADILTIEWDFGDSATASGTLTPSHVYADNGIYTVTLTVTDDDGATAADTLAVLVSNVAPLVDAGDDLSGFEGDTFVFSGSATDPGTADTLTVMWDFGDGTGDSGTLTPSHIYADDGIYTVTLTVTDDDGAISSDALTATVNNVAPTVSIDSIEQLQAFTLPDLTILILDPAVFTGSASDPGADALTYSWTFGDSTGAAGSTVTHSYGVPGTYPITLTVEDDDGGVGTASVALTVWGPRDLKTSVVSDLTALKTGECWVDKRLDRVIWYIERSINEKLWVDETHLDAWYGWRVFFYEFLAEIHLEIRSKLYNHLIPMLENWIEHLQAKGHDTTWLEAKPARLQALVPVFETALFKLAKADELLVRVAIMDAANTPVQNSKWQAKVDCYLAKAADHMTKAADRLEAGRFASAIWHYKIAWMSAQQAMKWANKTGSGCSCLW
ncbi:MAG: PKD domain-containing protein [Candidatus Heimdallarchaeota archaeon]